jgi:hypothetical protein
MLPLLPIFSVFSGIAGWVNSYLMRRKISALGTAVNELVQANYEIENKVIKVHDELITLTRITTAAFTNVEAKINATNAKFTEFVLKTQANFRQVQAQLKHVVGRFVNIRIHAEIATKVMYMMHNSQQYYQDLIRIATDFEAGVVDLMQGKIPARILPPSRMKELLINAEMEVYKEIHSHVFGSPALLQQGRCGVQISPQSSGCDYSFAFTKKESTPDGTL